MGLYSLTFHLISLCLSHSLCISSSALFVWVQKKSLEPSYFQPTSLSLFCKCERRSARQIYNYIWEGCTVHPLCSYIKQGHPSFDIYMCLRSRSPIMIYTKDALLSPILIEIWTFLPCKGFRPAKLLQSFREGRFATLYDRSPLVGMMTEHHFLIWA